MSYDYGQGLKGAGGGALAGFSVGGPLGAMVGGGLGLLGGFGGGENENDKRQREMLMQYYNQVGGRQAPQAGPASNSAYSGFRSNQTNLVSRLEAMANGQGPSLAKQQFEQATDRNMRGQQAMAASGRGGPLAQLTAANNMAGLGANAAQGSALARTNEQMQAIGQLGGVIAQGRGADEQTNMFNSQQNNNTALANLDARLRAMGMNDQARLGILSQMGGQNASQRNQVGLGDQILAGGAGMFAQGATQNAQSRVGSGPNYSKMQQLPGGGYYTQPAQQPGFNYNYGLNQLNR
jgi:hypothetical protein